MSGDSTPFPRLAAFTKAGVSASVAARNMARAFASPAMRAELDRQIDTEQAMFRLAAVVGPSLLLDEYAVEVERRWEFAQKLGRETTHVRPDKAALIRSMTAEISAGIL